MSLDYLRVVNSTRDRDLGRRVGLANRRWSRLRGLLGRKELPEGEGLLIHPCRAVHMYGMRFPLDVLFLDERGQVDALYEGLEPWKRTGLHREARYALELPVGTIAATETRKGDRIEWKNAD
ncbi:MAG: DUF192 domain-containing protein [Gemmatimonadota bacterium]